MEGHFSYILQNITLFEPRHNRTNIVACLSRKDTDRSEHLNILIRFFALDLKGTIGTKLP